MICDNLIDEILVKPSKDGGDKIFIVSGYASASMAYCHLKLIPENVKINLIIGMCPFDGIDKGNHSSFKRLVAENSSNRFACRYLIESPPVHSKIYTWVKQDVPFKSFTGSANYSQRAFYQNTREALTLGDPQRGLEYYNQLIPQSVNCIEENIDQYINIFDITRRRAPVQPGRVPRDDEYPVEGLVKVELELLAANGSPRSGLNWGHRGDQIKYNRNLNEAYIRVPAKIGRSDFFPETRKFFNLSTDDGRGFVCVVAQQNRKAIATPYSNALLGQYFRERLGLASGALVRHEDLTRYGRTDVTIYKIDQENYYLDFSA